ncbi:hypothetical protein GQ44DRAFT_763821 [Phaeosphaeriaceae sp. PMI808]|nr:hypothetical protein GQ44DRAFT_763821 [Phaeosphaeriaceae sp. PMI808]
MNEHRKCTECKPSVIYRRELDGPRICHLWQCCRCQFALNSDPLDAVCSFCQRNTHVAIDLCGDGWAYNESFDLSLEFEALDDTNESLSTLCFPEYIDTRLEVPPVSGDHITALRANLLRMEQLERHSDPTDTFGFISDFDDINSATAFSCEMDANSLPRIEFPTLENSRHPSTFPTPLSEVTLSDLNEYPNHVSELPLASNPYITDQCGDQQNIDSAYGSWSNGVSVSSESSKKRKQMFEDNQSGSSSSTVNGGDDGEENNATVSASKRRKQADPDGQRLACLFFKRDPSRCKNNSCAGIGYKSIHRLKEHLKQAHLHFQCERCQKTFAGKKGERALEDHKRLLEECVWRPVDAFWGINQTTLEKMRSRQGVQQMSNKERWHRFYQLLFPETALKELPSPYVDCSSPESMSQLCERLQNTSQQQISDHICRELFRLLPDRMSASIMNTINDGRLLAVWNQYVHDRLRSVLQNTLTEATSAL